MIVVSDTSPLCNLAIADHLWILPAIYGTVIIPPVVADELANARTIPAIQTILTLDWIQIHPLNTTLAESLQRDHGLDPGEAHAIALAVQIQADDLLIDERLGRQVAAALGISMIGIIGILRVAKHRGLISVVKPILDSMIDQAGFRVGKSLYDRILQDEGELI